MPQLAETPSGGARRVVRPGPAERSSLPLPQLVQVPRSVPTRAEPAPQTIPTARNAGEQDEDRSHDPDDGGKTERDADGPYERCDEHGNQDADHLPDSFPLRYFGFPQGAGRDGRRS